jgi:YD repeat-containing protein
MRYILIVLLFISVTQATFAQSAQNNEEKKFPNLPVSPSPKAYEMAKYVEFPTVDNYGLAPINIPILSLKDKDIVHNIELNYHGGGVKVAQEATWVGLGWNLKAGGVISRSIRDLADDEIYTYDVERENLSIGFDINDKITDYGWLSNPDRIKNFPEIETNPTPLDYKEVFFNEWDDSNLDSEINTGLALNALTESYRLCDNTEGYYRYDCEPDIYYLSVNDINVKFLFGFDGNVKLLNSNQKVQIVPTQASDGTITGFVVKDLKGYKYYFGGNYLERTTVSTDFHQIAVPSVEINNFTKKITINPTVYDECTISKTQTTAWYLYKIKSPNNNEMFFDYYAKTNIKMPIQANQIQTKIPDDGDENSFSLKNIWNNLRSIDHTINTYFLKDITFANGKLHFSISERSDLENGYKLDKIELSHDNALVKDCDFSYYYMKSTGNFSEKRLMLESIQLDDEPYNFEYYAGNLPAKDSYLQDFWGFYSSKSTGLIPKIYVYESLSAENKYRCFPVSGYNSTVIPGSDRTCDEDKIFRGTLHKIIYPTKGYTVYTFEPNTYFDEISQMDITGGGIRLATIEKYDNSVVAKKLLQKEFCYNIQGKSSGILINQLAFASPSNYAFEAGGSNPSALYRWECTGDEWDDDKIFEYFTVRSSNNFFPLTNMDGHQVAYTNVTILKEGNGKIEKEYYPPRNFGNNASTVNTSEINAFPITSDFASDRIIWPSSISRTRFYANCQSFYEWENGQQVEKDYLVYYSTKSGYYKSNEECYDIPDDFYCKNSLSYFGGGGQFAPYGYIKPTLSTTSYSVYGLWDNDFQIKYIDDIYFDGFLNDNSFNSFVWDYINWDGIPQSGSNIFPFPPLSDSDDDSLKYGLLKKELIYEEGDVIPKLEKHYDYQLYKTGDDDEKVFGLVSNNQFVVPKSLRATAWDAWYNQGLSSGAAYFFGYRHGAYSMPKAWAKYSYKVNSTALLTEVKTKEYFNGSVVERIEQYDYNNNFLITEEKLVSNSIGDQLLTKYYYPDDNPSGTNTNSTTLNKLIADNMNAIVLKKEKLLNGTSLIDGEINNYRIENNIVVQSDIKKAKTNGIYESRFIYDQYDTHGNIVQAHKSDDISTVFLWGFQGQYPVAKITNVTYDNVSQNIKSNISSYTFSGSDAYSNIENDILYLEGQLSDYINNPECHVTLYTFKPLVGITSETNPSGITTFYEYDDFNRLSTIRNDDGEILKKYEYNYSNN